VTLTPQQQQVLSMMAEGLTSRQLARRLLISESTVRFHVQNLKRMMGARTCAQLAAQAVWFGLIGLPDCGVGAQAAPQAGLAGARP
jgi:DNA-binding CsgD family transcriptional regulator